MSTRDDNASVDFIEVIPDAIDRATCAKIVARLQQSDALQPAALVAASIRNSSTAAICRSPAMRRGRMSNKP